MAMPTVPKKHSTKSLAPISSSAASARSLSNPGLPSWPLVGDGMRQQSGIAGRAFGTLGRNGISIRAISQGSTERNISIVIDAKHERKALQSLHQSFFETEVKTLHIFCLGVGNVGGTMIDQVLAQRDDLRAARRLDLRIMGLVQQPQRCCSPTPAFPATGRPNWPRPKRTARQKPLSKPLPGMDLENSVLVDNTASAVAAEVYEEASGPQHRRGGLQQDRRQRCTGTL